MRAHATALVIFVAQWVPGRQIRKARRAVTSMKNFRAGSTPDAISDGKNIISDSLTLVIGPEPYIESRLYVRLCIGLLYSA